METNYIVKKALSPSKLELQKVYEDKNLGNIKKARKQIETDAQILANRIALLKQEELKSWKKIEETKKKAREVYSLKRKNEEKLIEVSTYISLKLANIIND